MLLDLVSLLFEEFMLRALVAGVLAAALCALLGVIVVQRGMGFVSVGLSHSAFGGVALGLLLNTDPMLTAVPFVLVVALLIGWLGRRSSLKPDTLVGVLFSITMAMGVIFLHLKESYSADAMHYLFGSILTVGWWDCAYGAGSLALAGVVTKFLWGRWGYASFDRELAASDGALRARDDLVLMLLVALATIAAIKLVGMVMLASLLLIPPATARLLSRSLRDMTLISLLLGVLTVVCGLWISAAINWPSGATIVTLQSLVFVLAWVASGRLRVSM